MEDLEEAFQTQVIEAYSMTEASHQMTSSPLAPLRRKPGSVGLPAGPEVGIMDEAGHLLPPGEIGEVVIRGANVTKGYENNLKANQAGFTNGWFRQATRAGLIPTDTSSHRRQGNHQSRRREDCASKSTGSHPAYRGAQVVTFPCPIQRSEKMWRPTSQAGDESEPTALSPGWQIQGRGRFVCGQIPRPRRKVIGLADKLAVAGFKAEANFAPELRPRRRSPKSGDNC
jgi:hypothetical protein